MIKTKCSKRCSRPSNEGRALLVRIKLVCRSTKSKGCVLCSSERDRSSRYPCLTIGELMSRMVSAHDIGYSDVAVIESSGSDIVGLIGGLKD